MCWKEVLKLQHELQIAQMQVDQALSQAQTKVNEIEASSTNLFVSGWRPFVGWICGAGFAYEFLVQPFLTWAASMNGVPPPPPLDLSTLSTLLMGLLGLGGLRSFERYHGVHEK